MQPDPKQKTMRENAAEATALLRLAARPDRRHLDHITWRHYERHFRQRLELMAGSYSQDGFGSAFVPAASYRHEWRFAPGSVLDYGVAWSRPVYDGRREDRIAFDITYRWGQ